MRILVTGGAGYVGAPAVRLLMQSGHDVWVYDNLSTGHREAVPEGRLILGDLSEAERLDQALVEHRIDTVMHFAASAYVGESVQDPGKYYRNNVVNSLTLVERMRRCCVTRLVFSSSCVTYGYPERVPITEETPQFPINPYGNTKLACERAFADYARAYGFAVAALRYFNASGAAADGTLGEDHDPETHLIPRVIWAALGQIPYVEILGTDYPTPDGTCIRDYVHVEDLAEAHRRVLDLLRPGQFLAYNVATGHGASVRDVIRTVEEISGRAVPVREAPRRPSDPALLVADPSKIMRELGWRPHYPDLKLIVETAWRWHRDHPQGYRSMSRNRAK
jgi:UDP-glucose 4-epimerase